MSSSKYIKVREGSVGFPKNVDFSTKKNRVNGLYKFGIHKN